MKAEPSILNVYFKKNVFHFFTKKKVLQFLFLFFFCSNLFSQNQIREDILINNGWTFNTAIKNNNYPIVKNCFWSNVNIPHNYDAYSGYRRMLHGNEHGNIWYKKIITIFQPNKNRQNFLYFEGVSSYAKVFLNGKFVGSHAGGRTTFTINVTNILKTKGEPNELLVLAMHPANIKNLPWVCGGCSDDRGFSEGSQPMGIFRPVHLVVTNDVKVEPFGVHVWANIDSGFITTNTNTTITNYSKKSRCIKISHLVVDKNGSGIFEFYTKDSTVIAPNKTCTLFATSKVNDVYLKLWSVANPNVYKIITIVRENEIVIDKVETEFGYRTLKWNNASHQFKLNNEPVFINGIAEYEHLMGQSHAFSNEQIIARFKWMQAAGFNALRDAHQPHNLLYGKECNKLGILWWTQFSAHVWYNTIDFKNNFKQLLKEWVIERRNDPSVILWGLQNESKLPEEFTKECTALIQSLDPTASTQRLVTTCNGGSGTDWDVPQNWTGTYGGNPNTYDADLKKQILVGEYGAWRTLDLHTEGGFVANGLLSEDRMTLLMEQKIKLAEAVKDSIAGQFFWLLTSHDNPGRVQSGEGLREQDRIGPVNYKGLLTPWEEPTDAYYMYRSNYSNKSTNPMVYIVSHTWPNRWMSTGMKNNIIVYSNCDEVELFNDYNNVSLGKRKKLGIGSHFQWDSVNINYNILYAVGYVNGKRVAADIVQLMHLPPAPSFTKSYIKPTEVLKPIEGNKYFYRINCGGGNYFDTYQNPWVNDQVFYKTWTDDFAEMPKEFANQRRTFSPLINTNDSKLFQTFRYGKDKLKFNFDVENGEYDVELFFIEPWLGVGGGINAKGMRLFDVAINGTTVLDDVDIWNEVGTNKVLKKTVNTTVVNGKIVISFPETKVGQALISAIAISKKQLKYATKNRTKTNSIGLSQQYKLEIGDYVFANKNIQFNSLPSNLYGATWYQLSEKNKVEKFTYSAAEAKDVFICIKEKAASLNSINSFENTNTFIVTDENAGTKYAVYRKRLAKNDSINLVVDSNAIVCLQPVSNISPAYDLKPIKQFKSIVKELSKNVKLDSVVNRLCAVVDKNEATIVYPFQTGVADKYSITVKYYSNNENDLPAKLFIKGTGNSMMQVENINFKFTKMGKWNQFTISTNSMINAGNYIVEIKINNAFGLAISGIDVQ